MFSYKTSRFFVMSSSGGASCSSSREPLQFLDFLETLLLRAAFLNLSRFVYSSLISLESCTTSVLLAFIPRKTHIATSFTLSTSSLLRYLRRQRTPAYLFSLAFLYNIQRIKHKEIFLRIDISMIYNLHPLMIRVDSGVERNFTQKALGNNFIVS